MTDKPIDLAGADLGEAYLTGANMRGAFMSGADMSGAKWDEYTEWPEGIGPLPTGPCKTCEAAL